MTPMWIRKSTPASIVITSLPAFGTVVVNQTGVVQYTPGGGFRGNDSFRYTVRDTAATPRTKPPFHPGEQSSYR